MSFSSSYKTLHRQNMKQTLFKMKMLFYAPMFMIDIFANIFLYTHDFYDLVENKHF